MRQDAIYNPKPQSNQGQLEGLGLKGEQDVTEAQEWIDAHPLEWLYMIHNARRLKRSVDFVSANYLVNMVRNEHRVSVPNGLAPAFARLMMHECPDLRGAFKTYKSASDGYCHV